jgi:hypothetical protein
MKTFSSLTKSNCEWLRNQPLAVCSPAQGFPYRFTREEISGAVQHLKTLYSGEIKIPFAVKLMVLNELY